MQKGERAEQCRLPDIVYFHRQRVDGIERFSARDRAIRRRAGDFFSGFRFSRLEELSCGGQLDGHVSGASDAHATPTS